MAQTTWLSGQTLSAEKQSAVSDNAVDHSSIRAGPQWLETVCNQWQDHRLLGYQGRSSVKRDSQQPGPKLETTWLSGQVFSGERQPAASAKAWDYWATRTGLQWGETASSQCQSLRLIGYQDRSSVGRDSQQPVPKLETNWLSGQVFSGERQPAASAKAWD